MPMSTASVAIVVALPVDVTSPVKLALVVTVPAVKQAAVPDIFVPTNPVGVPNAGVVNVNPAIVVTVAPDAIDVLPIVGAECPETAAHVNPPVSPDCLERKCPLLPAFEILRLSSSTISLAIVVELPDDVTSPVKFALVVCE